MRSLPWLSVVVLLAACGPQDPLDGETEAALTGHEVGTEWRIRHAQTTVWLSSDLATARRDNRDVYILRGHASRNLEAGVLSFVPDDPFGMASITGPRSFEVVFDPTELPSIGWGTRVLIRLHLTGVADPIFVGATFAPKLDVQAGTAKIFVHPEIFPVLVDDAVRYRARASTTNGTVLDSVTNADGTAPALVKLASRTWRLEWPSAEVLSQAGHPTGDGLSFNATSSTGAVVKKASVKFGITTLEATQSEPYDYWQPATCKTSVKACLVGLAPGVVDTEPCGSAMQVSSCQVELRNALGPATFASDFQAHLTGWYAAHGDDVAKAGGNTLTQAQAAVNVAAITEVTSQEEDPFAHDLSKVRVFRHPDVAYPGSDIAWFGAYNRRTGALIEIYDFN